MKEEEILECIANIIQTPEVVDMLKKQIVASAAPATESCGSCCLNGGGGNGVGSGPRPR
jgi:hypothetical protein